MVERPQANCEFSLLGLRSMANDNNNAYTDTSGTVFEPSTARFSFEVGHEPGQLKQVLDVLARNSISLTYIESQPTSVVGTYNIFVDFSVDEPATLVRAERVLADLRAQPELRAQMLYSQNTKKTIWFPRRMADLDTFAAKVMTYGADLDADHPGFKDEVYRRRRLEITTLARSFRTGMALPHIEYTAEEVATWGVVFTKLKELYPRFACKQHRFVFPLLEAHCGYRADQIPQLEDVSLFLQSATGWRLRPVMGLLSPRDFLNGLAFRVFHSTQYIRHHSMPLYTPEPDVCHELLGHVPLYADPAFSEFSQEIGIASLGASDEEIERLSAVYWFTVEFGICREDGAVRAYGAGLLSSFGELEHACTSDIPKRLPFDPWVAATTKFPITSYQPTYFLASSFEVMTELVRRYASSFARENDVIYDPYTQTVRTLDSKNAMRALANQIKSETNILAAALQRL
jgi:phenylalanine-4-hydroxylase